jgi:hypothetical protein
VLNAAMEWLLKKINCFMEQDWLCIFTAVEVMDGYSAEWGALQDIIANAAGTALYVSKN